MRFGDDRSKSPAAKVSAHLRNETESTGPIAAFGDLNERVMRRRGEYARRRFVVKICRALISQRNHRERSRIRLRIADAQDVIDLAGADERIDLGHLSFQLIAISFNQTAGDYQARGLAIGL